jgi:hypothetical protein
MYRSGVRGSCVTTSSLETLPVHSAGKAAAALATRSCLLFYDRKRIKSTSPARATLHMAEEAPANGIPGEEQVHDALNSTVPEPVRHAILV